MLDKQIEKGYTLLRHHEREVFYMAGKKIMITLSEKKAEELEKLSKEKGVSKSVFVAMAIEEFVKRGENNEGK